MENNMTSERYRAIRAERDRLLYADAAAKTMTETLTDYFVAPSVDAYDASLDPAELAEFRTMLKAELIARHGK